MVATNYFLNNNNLEITIVRVIKYYDTIDDNTIHFVVKTILKNNTEHSIHYITFNFKYYDENNNLIDVATHQEKFIYPNCEEIRILEFYVTNDNCNKKEEDKKNKWEIFISCIESEEDIYPKDLFKKNLMNMLQK